MISKLYQHRPQIRNSGDTSDDALPNSPHQNESKSANPHPYTSEDTSDDTLPDSPPQNESKKSANPHRLGDWDGRVSKILSNINPFHHVLSMFFIFLCRFQTRLRFPHANLRLRFLSPNHTCAWAIGFGANDA